MVQFTASIVEEAKHVTTMHSSSNVLVHDRTSSCMLELITIALVFLSIPNDVRTASAAGFEDVAYGAAPPLEAWSQRYLRPSYGVTLPKYRRDLLKHPGTSQPNLSFP